MVRNFIVSKFQVIDGQLRAYGQWLDSRKRKLKEDLQGEKLSIKEPKKPKC